MWDLVEQTAFRPENEQSWLRCYSNQLHKLLQLEPQPLWENLSKHGSFEILALSIACRFKIEGQNAYLASLTNIKEKKELWAVHTDTAYLNKAALHMGGVDYPNEEIDTSLHSDVERVLDGMLLHLRNHTHLSYLGLKTASDDEPCRMLKAEEIRVTSSSYNGFVFLYHLAYQLCVVSKEARENEKRRLIDLFEHAIRQKLKVVPPSNLFKFC